MSERSWLARHSAACMRLGEYGIWQQRYCGASDLRRRRFSGANGSRLHQSGETQVGKLCGTMAIHDVPSFRCVRVYPLDWAGGDVSELGHLGYVLTPLDILLTKYATVVEIEE